MKSIVILWVIWGNWQPGWLVHLRTWFKEMVEKFFWLEFLQTIQRPDNVNHLVTQQWNPFWLFGPFGELLVNCWYKFWWLVHFCTWFKDKVKKCFGLELLPIWIQRLLRYESKEIFTLWSSNCHGWWTPCTSPKRCKPDLWYCIGNPPSSPNQLFNHTVVCTISSAAEVTVALQLRRASYSSKKQANKHS